MLLNITSRQIHDARPGRVIYRRLFNEQPRARARDYATPGMHNRSSLSPRALVRLPRARRSDSLKCRTLERYD